QSIRTAARDVTTCRHDKGDSVSAESESLHALLVRRGRGVDGIRSGGHHPLIQLSCPTLSSAVGRKNCLVLRNNAWYISLDPKFRPSSPVRGERGVRRVSSFRQVDLASVK